MIDIRYKPHTFGVSTMSFYINLFYFYFFFETHAKIKIFCEYAHISNKNDIQI